MITASRGFEVMTDTEWDDKWARIQAGYDTPVEYKRKPSRAASLATNLVLAAVVGALSIVATWGVQAFLEAMK